MNLYLIPIIINGKHSSCEVEAEDEHDAWLKLDSELSNELGLAFYESMGTPIKMEKRS